MMNKKRLVAVVGSRDATHTDVLRAFKDLKLLPKNHIIVSGGAKGADHWARIIAEDWGFEYIEVPAFWSRGKGAGFARNATMVNLVDAVVAVWDGRSPGTAHTIGYAHQKGKKVAVIPIVVQIDPDTQQVAGAKTAEEYAAEADTPVEPEKLWSDR